MASAAEVARYLDELLAATSVPDYPAALNGLQFDHIISVASAGAFKPHRSTYTQAAALVGVKMDEVIFVANHAFDCIGAKAAGMRTVFIDRRKRPFGDWPYQPDLIIDDFKSLAELLA